MYYWSSYQLIAVGFIPTVAAMQYVELLGYFFNDDD
jgi:hypothetical protein